jgi:hypothetical protein
MGETPNFVVAVSNFINRALRMSSDRPASFIHYYKPAFRVCHEEGGDRIKIRA